MRYNDRALVAAFLARGEYPAIHDPLFRLVVEESTGASVLDLCSSTGLLSRRIASGLALAVLAVDADPLALAQVPTAPGLDIETLLLRVTPATVAALGDAISRRSVDTLVARRCFPELAHGGFEEGLWGGFLADHGVRDVFVQGRKVSTRSRDPLASLADEVAHVGGPYRVSRQVGECAHLRV